MKLIGTVTIPVYREEQSKDAIEHDASKKDAMFLSVSEDGFIGTHFSGMTDLGIRDEAERLESTSLYIEGLIEATMRERQYSEDSAKGDVAEQTPKYSIEELIKIKKLLNVK